MNLLGLDFSAIMVAISVVLGIVAFVQERLVISKSTIGLALLKVEGRQLPCLGLGDQFRFFG